MNKKNEMNEEGTLFPQTELIKSEVTRFKVHCQIICSLSDLCLNLIIYYHYFKANIEKCLLYFTQNSLFLENTIASLPDATRNSAAV